MLERKPLFDLICVGNYIINNYYDLFAHCSGRHRLDLGSLCGLRKRQPTGKWGASGG